ncbi:CheR family methyltransferase, partial [Singulisphaera rosea]
MTWTEPAFDAVARLVGVRTGLVFLPERRAGVELGIRRAMSRAGVNDPSLYMARIVDNPTLLEDLIGELTIGETYFFREPGHFEFVRRVAIPRLLETRGPSHAIRAWSAGCSSGEEAYSLALLFKEVGLAGRSKISATDISPVALAKARRGVYGSWSFRGEDADMARSHLDRQGNDYVIPESLRDKVSFSTLNLASEDYPSFTVGVWGMDLIFCRNVLIYFDRPMIRQVANRLYASLAEGGWLLTASSDPPLGGEAPFETVLTDYGVFYRRGPAAVEVPKPKTSPFEGSIDLRLSSDHVTPAKDPGRLTSTLGAGPTKPAG